LWEAVGTPTLWACICNQPAQLQHTHAFWGNYV